MALMLNGISPLKLLAATLSSIESMRVPIYRYILLPVDVFLQLQGSNRRSSTIVITCPNQFLASSHLHWTEVCEDMTMHHFPTCGCSLFLAVPIIRLWRFTCWIMPIKSMRAMLLVQPVSFFVRRSRNEEQCCRSLMGPSENSSCSVRHELPIGWQLCAAVGRRRYFSY